MTKIMWNTLTVSNVQDSSEFYSNVLGLELKSESTLPNRAKINFLSDDEGFMIELYQPLVEEEKPEDGDYGNHNISFGLKTDRYEEILKMSRERDIVVMEPTILGGQIEAFFIIDPDDNMVQIIK